jgi:ERF superfamily
METTHKNIYAALAAAQSAMGPALKQAVNLGFKTKYADLASVMDACLPALTANGICVMQPTGEDEVGRYVKTILAHVSGETVECRVPLIVAKNDMQGYGSAVTYARRYGLMSMAGIAPEDDDGNAAAKAPPKDEPVSRGPTAMQVAAESLFGAETLDQLSAIWKDLPRSVQGDKSVIAAKDKRKAEMQMIPADIGGDEIPY